MEATYENPATENSDPRCGPQVLCLLTSLVQAQDVAEIPDAVRENVELLIQRGLDDTVGYTFVRDLTTEVGPRTGRFGCGGESASMGDAGTRRTRFRQRQHRAFHDSLLVTTRRPGQHCFARTAVFGDHGLGGLDVDASGRC